MVALPGPPGEKGEPGLPGFGLPGKQVSSEASGAGMQAGLTRREGPCLGALAPWTVGSRWECGGVSASVSGLTGLCLCPGTQPGRVCRMGTTGTRRTWVQNPALPFT